jgi:hypothetical protein
LINIYAGSSGCTWTEGNLEVRLLGEAPVELPEHPNRYIFLTTRYIKTKSQTNNFSFVLFSNGNMVPMAIFNLATVDFLTWNSPSKAPFGGIQHLEGCDENGLMFLLKCAEKFLKIYAGKKIIIKTPPENYDTIAYKELYGCYKRLNYKCKKIHKNHIIPVATLSFSEIIAPAEKRRIKKCKREAFTVSSRPAGEADAVYDFIKAVRNKMGYTLSITSMELRTLVQTFPDDVKLFSVSDQNTVIACAVTVRINKNILYNFLVADLAAYRQFSPVVFLTDYIYQYCQHEKIRMLDLGTSLDHHGNEKPSLIRFKENMGGKECRKITWEKEI